MAARGRVRDHHPRRQAVSEIGWRESYCDGRLRTVVGVEPATSNRDLRIATLNIQRARALYRIRRADQFPTIEAARETNLVTFTRCSAADGRRSRGERLTANARVRG
jgi:outer membrane protein, multidrug efflux system